MAHGGLTKESVKAWWICRLVLYGQKKIGYIASLAWYGSEIQKEPFVQKLKQNSCPASSAGRWAPPRRLCRAAGTAPQILCGGRFCAAAPHCHCVVCTLASQGSAGDSCWRLRGARQ